jgi:hypothetical protein
MFKIDRRTTLSLVFSLIFAVIVLQTDFKAPLDTLTITLMSPPHNDTCQLFYNIGNRYNESDSAFRAINKTKGKEDLVFKLPAQRIRDLRIDPANTAGTIAISSISIASGTSVHTWEAKDIESEFVVTNQLSSLHEMGGIFYMYSTGNDPNFEFKDFSKVYSAVKRQIDVWKMLLYAASYSLGMICLAGKRRRKVGKKTKK